MKFEEIKSKIASVITYMPDNEREFLFRYAQGVPENGIIVDIGTASGSSAFIMALGSKDSTKIFTVDTNRNDNFISDRKRLGFEEKITYIEDTSKTAFTQLNKYKIDLLFIDGNHTDYNVKEDFNLYSQLLTGVVIFHDILFYNYIGVFVQTLLAENKLLPLEVISGFENHRNMMVGMFAGRKP